MGGNGTIDLSQIPLMTKAQEGALAELLPAVMGLMSGFPLGEAYTPGAYNVRTFPEFAGEHIRKENGEEDGGGRDGGKITKGQLTAPHGGITKEHLTSPGGGGGDGTKEVIRDGTVVRKDTGGTVGGEAPTEGRTALSEILDMVQRRQAEPTLYGGRRPVADERTMRSQILESMFSPSAMPVSPGTMPFSPVNVPPAADMLPPEAQPMSAISQLLTQPFTQPFREGMTGNYPRRQI